MDKLIALDIIFFLKYSYIINYKESSMTKELLAPAGDIEAGYAALYYGADAIYLGLQQFSARATAANFDETNLAEFVAYAHSLKRKVYVALNTLIEESELPDLIKNLEICVRTHVDALIVQDLGVARIVKANYPELELHASTQMAVHNKEGALALQKAGFSRVVLARELTLSEIREIAAIPGLETEAFIHGALCYSYSGLCLFSSLEYGRSANRGKCLYPCRAEFGGEDGNKHYFSMKDMALEENVLKMPVTSLKIEGRKKTALYVAAVTDYYRNILDGKGAIPAKADNIKQIFARPWCDFHFKGRNKDIIDREFVGHRGLLTGRIEQIAKNKIIFKTKFPIARHDGIQIDVDGQEKPFGFAVQEMRINGKNGFEAKAGDVVEVLMPPKAPFLRKGQNIYLASSSRVKGAYDYTKPKLGAFKPRRKVAVVAGVSESEVWAQAEGQRVSLSGSFTTADNPLKTKEAFEKAFAKGGDVGIELIDLTLENPQNLFVPVSMLNELRRQLYASLPAVLSTPRELPEVTACRRSSTPQWIIRTDQKEVLQGINCDAVAEITFMLSPESTSDDWKHIPKNKLRFALPVVARNPKLWAEITDKLLAQGYRKWEIGNYWGLEFLPHQGIDLSFDTSLYMLNSQAIMQAKEMGASRVCLSIEDNLENWQKLSEVSPLPIVFSVYQDAPLFTSAACIRSNPCKICPRGTKWLKLTRDGQEYDVLSKDCQTMLFAREPLCLGAQMSEVAADFYRADFLYKPYQPQQVREIMSVLKSGKDVPNCRKGNLKRRL